LKMAKEQSKQLKFITEQDTLIIPELVELCCITQEDIENGEIQDFFACDPDYVKSDGYSTPFVTVDDYIISPFELEPTDKVLIKWYFRGAENRKNEKNSWEIWSKTKDGIAYRGGVGYVYDIAVYSYKK